MTNAATKKRSAPRVHVLLSRDGRSAVAIRRGPSKYVCTVGWDRKDDTFRLGQWLRGRIYERRCDLSPDGKYLIYFAMNGRWQSETRGSWSAISRAPYLKAIALWPKGDCWNGGGLFLSKKRYWLNDGCTTDEDGRFPRTTEVQRDLSYRHDPGVGNNECLGVYYPRLLRDGWTLIRAERDGNATFEKRLGRNWILRKIAKAGLNHPIGRGVYDDQHELVNTKNETTRSFPRWEWAELDGRRLVWVDGGRLFGGVLSATELADVRELHDFTSYSYERIEAPY